MKQTVLKNNLQNLLESAENILLLQGPVGDFFLRLANWLTENGKPYINSTLMQATTIFIRPLKRIPLFLTTTTMPFLNFCKNTSFNITSRPLSALVTHALITSLQNALQTKTKPVSGRLKKAISAPTTSP